MKFLKFIIKWGARLVTALIIVLFIVSAFAFFLRTSGPPSIEKAPWCVQTFTNDEFRLPSRYYYGEDVEITGGITILTGRWWDYDGKKYHRHSGNKEFSFDEYGKINLIRRK